MACPDGGGGGGDDGRLKRTSLRPLRQEGGIQDHFLCENANDC